MIRRWMTEPWPDWIPLAAALEDLELPVPEIVFTLAYRRFELDRGGHPPDLERAIATTAAVLKRPYREIERAVVIVASKPQTEAALRERCARLTPRLAALPGVRSVSPPNYGGMPLVVAFRHLAAHRGHALPKMTDANPGWKALLSMWRERGAQPPWRLSVACRWHRVTLVSGAVLDSLDPDTADQTIAEVVGRTAAEVHRAIDRGFIEVLGLGASPDEYRRAIAAEKRAVMAQLRGLPGVMKVEETPLKTASYPIAPYEGPEVSPPWRTFSEPPSSLRWRMGPGEDHMQQWFHFWLSLAAAARADYLKRFPPPAAWRSWMDGLA